MGKIIFIILVVLAVIIGGPIATILALNTLFNLAIPVTIETWLSTFWLAAIVSGTAATVSRKK